MKTGSLPESAAACLLVLFCLLSLRAGAQQKDAALWTGVQLEKDVFTSSLTAHLKAQGRLNENFTHLDYAFLDGGLSYRFNRYVAATAAYVLNFKNSPVGGNWREREQFYANVQFRYKFRKFRFSDRNQFQTDLEDTRFRTGSWFYRNKAGVTYYPFKHWSYSASFESYFRLGQPVAPEKHISRKRFAVGMSYETSKHSSVELGYLIQQQVRAKQPDYIYAVTMGYNYEFGGVLFKKKKKQRVAPPVPRDLRTL